MNPKKEHITVCICTYKRQSMLQQLLRTLQQQEINDSFDFSIVVVDNDRDKSAKRIVEESEENSKIRIIYCDQPEQNIALARNRAVESAHGEYLAFIDDDEFPVDSWLVSLYTTCQKQNADGVLGPVVPSFDIDPPKWVEKGKFFERPSHSTGTVLSWKDTRTGNVLFRKHVFDEKENRFNRKFLSSEDKEFFFRMIKKGFVFVWCDEARVYETVDPARWKRSFMIKRALFRGKMASMYPDAGLQDMMKSIVAVILYAMIMPFLIFIGQHMFMKYLIKICDHGGKLLAFCKVDVAGDKRP